jgi:hypothetical protein
MFELTIKCTKDINDLRINFTDGTVTTATTDSSPVLPSKEHTNLPPSDERIVPSQPKEKSRSPRRKEEFLDTDVNFGDNFDDTVVELPEIHISDRPVNVAPELQSLDI